MAVINGIILKGRHIVIPDTLLRQVLEQLDTNLMGMEKIKILAPESIYWPGINGDTEKYIRNYSTCLEFQQMQSKE